ncbi:undecaprenyl-diphosphatase [Martelella mediterranea]|uniref:Undecaprenyl-diphosphatase n=1 Tax=Martelella mediterranea TaxID=293089 RepID=A0A4R3NTG8_9HYPH|nr:undecaprenyl-diphosphatase [Martelella mediterranea]
MAVPFRWLSKHRKLKTPMPCCQWRGFLVGTLGVVAVSFAVLDYPVATMTEHLSPAVRYYGEMITDFGSAEWMLISSFVAIMLGLTAAGVAKKTDVRTRAKGVLFAQAASFIFICVASSGLLVNLIKKSIGRARPSMLYQDYGAFSFHPLEFSSKFASFPSGHSTTTAAFFAAAAFFFPRHRVLFFSLAVCIAMSRTIVGAHYPSDVVAGLAFGAWWTYLVALFFAHHRMVFRIDPTGWPVPRNSMTALKLDFGHRQKVREEAQKKAAKRAGSAAGLDLHVQKRD